MSEIEMCDEAKGVVHWFGVFNQAFPDVDYIGAIDMGQTIESFNAAWDEHLSDKLDIYCMVLREDQAQHFAINILDALEELTQQRVRGEVE